MKVRGTVPSETVGVHSTYTTHSTYMILPCGTTIKEVLRIAGVTPRAKEAAAQPLLKKEVPVQPH